MARTELLTRDAEGRVVEFVRCDGCPRESVVPQRATPLGWFALPLGDFLLCPECLRALGRAIRAAEEVEADE